MRCAVRSEGFEVIDERPGALIGPIDRSWPDRVCLTVACQGVAREFKRS